MPESISNFIEALKGQPTVLALVAIVLSQLALIYVIVRASEHRQQLFVEQQKQLITLVEHCQGAK